MIVLWSQHPFNHIQFPDSIVYGVKVIVCCQQVLGIGVSDGPKRGEIPFQCLWFNVFRYTAIVYKIRQSFDI